MTPRAWNGQSRQRNLHFFEMESAMPDIFSPQSPVFISVEGSLGYIVLNRPEKRNAMSGDMWGAIPMAVSALDADPNVRVIVVKSATDKAFSAGADIAELEAVATDPNRREANRLAIRNAQRTLARAKKPTIAQISGACVGGGCGIAIHCDFRISDTTAKLGITPAKLGIIYPLNDTKQLMDLVGLSKAKSMLFTGRLVDANEALNMGLVDTVVEPASLEGAVKDFALQLGAVSQYSLDGIKRSIQRILDGQIDDDAETASMFINAHEALDAQEGIKAFLEKRPAEFRWVHRESEEE